MPTSLRTRLSTGCAALALSLAALTLVPPPPAQAVGKRATPDYDGRGEAPMTAAEGLLWVPRILVSPLYLVSEYVLRRPLGFLITEAERTGLPHLLADLFTFGEGGKTGIIPTALFDFGLEAGFIPSFGVYFFTEDLIADGNDFTIRGAIGGKDWVQVKASDSFTWGEDDAYELSLTGFYGRRRDWVFAGIGPDWSKLSISRYGEQHVAGEIAYEMKIGARGWLEASTGPVSRSFFRATCCDDGSIERAVDEGRVAGLPPAYEDGYLAWDTHLAVAYDTRGKRPGPESGFRAQVDGALAFRMDGEGGAGWARYGARLGGFLDLYSNRVLGLLLHASFADPLEGGGVLPFTEYAMLGGEEPMTAFVEGRLRGRSSERRSNTA